MVAETAASPTSRRRIEQRPPGHAGPAGQAREIEDRRCDVGEDAVVQRSSFDGSPGDEQSGRALSGGVVAVGGGGVVAGGGALEAAGGTSSPCRRTSEYERLRRTLAVQFWPLMKNWYCPVSSNEISLSDAVTVVMMVARRGSIGDVAGQGSWGRESRVRSIDDRRGARAGAFRGPPADARRQRREMGAAGHGGEVARILDLRVSPTRGYARTPLLLLGGGGVVAEAVRPEAVCGVLQALRR